MKSGPAVVRDLRRGYTYVAEEAVYDGNAVTFTGRLRQRALSGERLGAPRSFTLSIARAEVEWLDSAPGANGSEQSGVGL